MLHSSIVQYWENLAIKIHLESKQITTAHYMHSVFDNDTRWPDRTKMLQGTASVNHFAEPHTNLFTWNITSYIPTQNSHIHSPVQAYPNICYLEAQLNLWPCIAGSFCSDVLSSEPKRVAVNIHCFHAPRISTTYLWPGRPQQWRRSPPRGIRS